jgi:hypothetical protein
MSTHSKEVEVNVIYNHAALTIIMKKTWKKLFLILLIILKK